MTIRTALLAMGVLTAGLAAPAAAIDAPPVAPAANINGFADVPAGSWFEAPVAWLVQEGITNGLGDGTYGAERPVTRAQMAAFLHRDAGSPPVDGEHGFRDVPTDTWMAEPIAWLVSEGITSGIGGGFFAPNRAVTRAEMAAFLHRRAGSPTGAPDPGFPDVPAGVWFREPVAWLADRGITSGLGDGRYGTNDLVTRAQLAAFLHRDAGSPDLLAGRTVTILGPERAEGAVAGIEAALDAFAAQTGLTIEYESTADFEADINTRIGTVNAPDIAFYPGSRGYATHARGGDLVALPPSVVDATEPHWPSPWWTTGQVDGTAYGVPVRNQIKSLVWYIPTAWADRGYAVPTTLTEFELLVAEMIANGDTPLCVGIESGFATGWPYTDWVEDYVLRNLGPAVYDQWVAHEIPFDDPRIVAQMQEVLDLWNTFGATFANGGTIATTNFGDNHAPLVDGDCMMHRQADFFSGFFDRGTVFGPTGVDIFPFPSDSGSPVVGVTQHAAALDDRPEIWAVIEYLATATYAERRQAAQSAVYGGDISGFLSAVNGLDESGFNDVERSILDVMTEASVVREDASDLMPVQTTFWSEGTAAVMGTKTAQAAAAAIEAAWP